MKVKVRLFGTLGNQFPNHDSLKGFEIELPEAANVADLIDHLKLPKLKVGIVSVDGQLVKSERNLKEGDFVRIFQPIFGG
jgi:sulfur carrier protein ThiS